MGRTPVHRGIDLLLAESNSLGIPSLFPMQIKLMRIRNIMEPIHRSSWWKMGLTTNFPLQLFCNYSGALCILMEILSWSDSRLALFSPPPLLIFSFFPEKKKKKKNKREKEKRSELFSIKALVFDFYCSLKRNNKKPFLYFSPLE